MRLRPIPGLKSATRRVLTKHLGRPCTVKELRHRPYDYASSYHLEELEVVLESDEVVPLIWKDLSPGAISAAARAAKPAFLLNPLRELETYVHVLSKNGLGPGFVGCEVDQEESRYWLFLEKSSGDRLYEIGDLEVWQSAARWLAHMHTSLAEQTESLLAAAPLLVYDRAYFEGWLNRAERYGNVAPLIFWLRPRYGDIVDALLDLPRTFIHGEFYDANILVEGSRVLPVDWEMAAIGPGLVDLAALTAGEWTEAERQAIVHAYYEAISPTEYGSPAKFLRALDLCRLHLAIQQLGWSAGRRSAEVASNGVSPIRGPTLGRFGRNLGGASGLRAWHSEAITIATKLGL